MFAGKIARHFICLISVLCVHWRKAGLNKKQCREFQFFSCFTHSVRCNVSKPSSTQLTHPRNTRNYVQMWPLTFWDAKQSMRLLWIHFFGWFFIVENHTIRDLYEALYKIYMISMKYNTMISYAKSAMREMKGWNRVLFYKTQETLL